MEKIKEIIINILLLLIYCILAIATPFFVCGIFTIVVFITYCILELFWVGEIVKIIAVFIATGLLLLVIIYFEEKNKKEDD